MSYERWRCRKCGDESIIKVAVSNGVQLYSCMDDECKWNASLLIMMDEGVFVEHNDLLETLRKMWGEHEQDSIQESKD